MATLNDLLDEIRNAYDVVELIDRGTTAGGKIKEYDLWYKENGVVKYKRIHIYTGPDNTAEWFGSNPIPQKEIVSFAAELREEMEKEISEMSNAIHYTIEQMDEDKQRALAVVYLDDGTSIVKKRVFLKKNKDGTWDFRVRDFA